MEKQVTTQQVLELMQQHESVGAPATIAELTKELHISMNAVYNRLHELKRNNLITVRTTGKGYRLLGSKYLDAYETAAILGISRGSIGEWISSGRLTTSHSQDGRFLYFDKNHVESVRLQNRPIYQDIIIDPAWANWIRGFVDGEGTLCIIRGNGSPYKDHPEWISQPTIQARFGVYQHTSKIFVLERIQRTFQCGYVWQSIKNNKYKVSSYSVTTLGDLERVIIPFFDAYPLIVKEREYAIWREAVLLMRNQHKNDSYEHLCTLKEQLRILYSTRPDYRPENEPEKEQMTSRFYPGRILHS